MPPQEISHRPHLAVWWEKTGQDRYNNPKLAEPVEIRVRWIHTRSNMLDPDGERIVVDASAILAQDVKVGDQLWLGALEDWLGTGSGTGEPENEIMEVVAFEKTDDVKGRSAFREAGLKKYRATRGELE